MRLGKRGIAAAGGVVVISTVAAAAAIGLGGDQLSVEATGFEEVPAVSTNGKATFAAQVANDETSISWTLKYSDLEGAVQQAHIHVGQKNVNGGIAIWLCTNLGNGPAGTQPCPPPPAEI